jgi:hypothetical protein
VDTAARASDRSSDLLWGALVSGAYASAATALLFLIIDGIQGQPLQTASLLGSVVLLGQDPSSAATAFRLDMVSLYSFLHLAVFVLVGAAATKLYLSSSLMRRPLALVAVLTASLTAGGLLADAFLYPGIVSALGALNVVAGNLAAASAMTWVLAAGPVSTRRQSGDA